MFIVKCRPTYIGYVLEHNINWAPKQTIDFLSSLNTNPFTHITPTILDNIIIQLQTKPESWSIAKFQNRYQCSAAKLNRFFKTYLGMTFKQYQQLLIQST